MRLNVTVKIDLRTKEVGDAVLKASRLAMRDTIIDIAKEAVENSPVSATYPSISKVNRPPTGNNKRSIKFESSGFETGEGVIDQNGVQGAVYGTSGYSGYLEVGTALMLARGYLKPALDRHFTPEKFTEKVKRYTIHA